MFRQLFRFIHHVWLAPPFALVFLAFLELLHVTPELVREDPREAVRRLRVYVDPRVPAVVYRRFLDPDELQHRFVYLEACLTWWRWLPSLGLFVVFVAWRAGLL